MQHLPDRIKAFETEFQSACIKHDITAAFVLIKGDDAKGSLIMIGGCSELSDFIETALLPNTTEAQDAKH